MTKVIQETKEHIKRIFPQAKDVEVRVKKDAGKFVSKIHLRTSSCILHAMKADPNFRRSLSKTYHAILSQVQRFKDRRKKRRAIEQMG
jgi:ribosome-associated translation inhibitor RaiA